MTDDEKILFHLVKVESMLKKCPKCDETKFSPKIHKADTMTEYYTECVNCGYLQLDGFYVSTINDCGEACKIK